jgi:hypothetical protein
MRTEQEVLDIPHVINAPAQLARLPDVIDSNLIVVGQQTAASACNGNSKFGTYA